MTLQKILLHHNKPIKHPLKDHNNNMVPLRVAYYILFQINKQDQYKKISFQKKKM